MSQWYAGLPLVLRWLISSVFMLVGCGVIMAIAAIAGRDIGRIDLISGALFAVVAGFTAAWMSRPRRR